jgi:glycosyltransferase involved in cell wall biosynthesis
LKRCSNSALPTQGPSSELPSSSRPSLGTSQVEDPWISVVVPTRDRPGSLRRCLDALASQTVLDKLEVIVVDDGSTASAAVEEVVARYPFTRLISQTHSGPASARNAGAARSRGEFVCFTDDDCEPSPAWAERLVHAIEAGADAAAGKTLRGDPGSALAAASELIAGAPALLGEPSAGELTFAPSNNLACRGEVLTEVPFDERYPAAAGEDRDWCRRLLAGCYVLRREPGAALVHRPEPTFRAFLRQQVRYGRGAFWFRRRGPERQPLESPEFYLTLLRSSFRQGFRTGLLVAVAQAATAVGFLLAWAGERER